eukprot:SAG31_NODE_601_length_13643_cov_64.237005_12_plen_107_part_00
MSDLQVPGSHKSAFVAPIGLTVAAASNAPAQLVMTVAPLQAGDAIVFSTARANVAPLSCYILKSPVVGTSLHDCTLVGFDRGAEVLFSCCQCCTPPPLGRFWGGPG